VAGSPRSLPRSTTATCRPLTARAAARNTPRVPPHTTTSHWGRFTSGLLSLVTMLGAGPAAAPTCCSHEGCA
jgi:hypothetical protein